MGVVKLCVLWKCQKVVAMCWFGEKLRKVIQVAFLCLCQW